MTGETTASALVRAESVVRRARSRLARVAAMDGSARGALGGALAGIGAAVAAHLVAAPPPALVALPFAGAVLGAAWALRRPPSLASAALSLDRAAATDEAFISALTAKDAAPWVLEFTAARAVGRCDEASVARVLRLSTPAAGAAAAVATALLAAIVLVPAARNAEPVPAAAAGSEVPAASGAPSSSAPASPSHRTAALADAVRTGDAAAEERLRATVRGDLGAVPDDDLRKLAETLAARGSDDARRALDALAKGDRGAAIDALRAALGAHDAGTAVAAGGGEAPGAAAPATSRRVDPWSGASWPLRYDSGVRRYLEEIR